MRARNEQRAGRDPMSAIPIVSADVDATEIAGGLLLERRLVPRGPLGRFVERRFALRRARRFELDRVGADFYRAIDGCRTLSEIARALGESHALGPEQGQAAVAAFTKTLLARGLILLRLDG